MTLLRSLLNAPGSPSAPSYWNLKTYSPRVLTVVHLTAFSLSWSLLFERFVFIQNSKTVCWFLEKACPRLLFISLWIFPSPWPLTQTPNSSRPLCSASGSTAPLGRSGESASRPRNPESHRGYLICFAFSKRFMDYVHIVVRNSTKNSVFPVFYPVF